MWMQLDKSGAQRATSQQADSIYHLQLFRADFQSYQVLCHDIFKLSDVYLTQNLLSDGSLPIETEKSWEPENIILT